ncbi:MAG: HD domain-containing protein [Actinomycetota bacterium]|nr:HD domain-containing protein [Actinomycetota bacterium]
MKVLPNTLTLDDLSHIDPFLGSLLAYLASLGGREIYLVGGYLRDYFLGDVAQDIDFITSVDPGEVAMEVASRWDGKGFLLHEEERTYRVVIDGDGRRRTLDFAPIRGISVEEDLSYRDFTINAMAVDLERLVREELRLPRDLIDKNYGWRDLSRGILRECSNESFLMDPVRLMRAMRFRHLLGLEYEERTLNHMRKYAPLVTKVPGERITVELVETLLYPETARIFAELESTGLLQYVFPDLTETVGLEQNAYHHLDVWSHTLLTLEKLDDLLQDPGKAFPRHAERIEEHMQQTLQDLQPRSSFLRLAALYHDTGKVKTLTRDDSGRIHFYSHQKYSQDAVLRLAERLRLSRRATDYLACTVGRHMDIGITLPEHASERQRRKMVTRLGEELVDVVLLSTADRLATQGPLNTPEEREAYIATCDLLLDAYFREKDVAPLIGGRDLMRELGLAEGPAIGEILKEVRIAQLEGALKTREEALRFAADLIRFGD